MSFLREGHDVVINHMEEGNAIFIAPTSYGKSKGVPFIQKKLGFYRSVHSFPLRSLVKEQLNFLREQGFRACHASGLLLPDKCPYMGGTHVVSTVDYLSLVLLRLPPPELGWILRYSLGHYEYPRANVFNSLLVFDEAHLLSEPWSNKPSKGRDFLYASLDAAKEMNLKTLIMTATLPEREIEKMKRVLKAKVIAICRKCYKNVDVERIDDFNSNLRWVTETYGEDIIEFVSKRKSEIIDETSNGKVLITVNTVPKAMQVYDMLRDFEDIVLVHGRLSENDKEEAIKKIEKARIVISTQVIEAGVDVDATWLITESAPMSSLVQRAGRLCRKRVCDKAKVTILPGKEPYGEEALRAYNEILRVKEIEWRLLDDSENGLTFLKLINVLENTYKPHGFKNLYKHIITVTLPNISGIKKMLNNLCSFIRESALVEIRVGTERVDISLEWLRVNSSKLRVKDVKAIRFGKDGFEEVSLGPSAFELLVSGCRGYSHLLERYGAYSLVVDLDPKHYVRGYGLIT